MAIPCFVWMVNTFLKYLLTSGAILMIDFDDFLSSVRIMKYIRKTLTYQTGDFYCHFLHTKNIQEHSWDQGIVSLEATFNDSSAAELVYADFCKT